MASLLGWVVRCRRDDCSCTVSRRCLPDRSSVHGSPSDPRVGPWRTTTTPTEKGCGSQPPCRTMHPEVRKTPLPILNDPTIGRRVTATMGRLRGRGGDLSGVVRNRGPRRFGRQKGGESCLGEWLMSVSRIGVEIVAQIGHRIAVVLECRGPKGPDHGG